jgi:hypothetical protein
MRVTVFWNKGRRDGRQAARRFFALSKSGGLTKSTSPIGQLKAASHDILQTGQTQIIAPHNPVVIRDSLCVAVIIKSLSGKSTSSSKHRLSDNVGPCQALLSALLHALKEERHFALMVRRAEKQAQCSSDSTGAACACDSSGQAGQSHRLIRRPWPFRVGGTVLDRRTLLSRQLKPAAKTLGLGNVNWHLLRHSNATLHDSIGTPLGTVQALLGHSSSEITRQVYLHSLSAEVAVEGSINYWTQIGPKFWIWATGASRIR